jgi:protein-disulfide isomerase
LVALALGALLSGVILYVHMQLAATNGNYTSFCNVNARVNCDVVLASPYGSLLGVPVAVWALLAYLGQAAVVVARRRRVADARVRASRLMILLAVWSLTFSLYMAAVAALVIGAVCLLCSGLYVVNAAVALLAWRVARADETAQRPVLARRALAVGAAAIVVGVAAVGGVQLSSTLAVPLTSGDVQTQNPEFFKWYTSLPVVDAIPVGDHVRGPADAAITLVEFSDFECAYCAKAFRDLRDLERRHAGSIRVEFRHFPLDPHCNPNIPSRVHRSACLAAIAAECAARFGRFWEYHDRLFADQNRLGRDGLVATAADLGIDPAAFTACLDDPEPRTRVLADAAVGARLGVKSTPTLFINGRTVEGALERNAYEYVLALERHG